MKISQRHINEVNEQCGGLVSFIFTGEPNVGKTTAIMNALKYIGITSTLSAAIKTKDITKAGLRVIQKYYPNQTIMYVLHIKILCILFILCSIYTNC